MSHPNRDTGDDVRASDLDDGDTRAPWLVEPQRVRAAGAKTHLFESDAVTLVFQHSRRIPRLVQNLALGSLLATATANKKAVDADAVQALLDQDAS